MDSQNIPPNKKYVIPNNQILLLGYLSQISIEIKLPIPKIVNNMNKIIFMIEFAIFIVW